MSKLTFRRLAVGLLALAVLPAHTLTAAAPKNVILFIGDGMGFEHVKAARLYNGGPLSFEGLPAQAQVTTYSANNAITDSAAGGTALATGRKVNNYVVSQALPGDGSDLPTSLEQFKAAGKKTGLITTTYLTHATPATFGAHVADRNSTADVASDFLARSQPNIMFGGGGNGLTPASTAAAGYQVATDTTSFNALRTTASHISAQFGESLLPYERDYPAGTYPFPHLSDMVEKALNALTVDADGNGLFLMVEGGMIDQAAHGKYLERTVHEVLEFSRAVQVALNWANQRTDTLILVTADHETGGLTVTGDNGPGNYPTVTWSTTGHTAANVPAYAIGVDAQRVMGVLDNTDIYSICMGLVTPTTGTLIAKGSTWRYNDSGADLGTEWKERAYADAAWPAGPAELGYGDGDEKTVLFSATQYTCYYFRHRFTIANADAYTNLKLRLKRDDGAVVYLNGTEVWRTNLPTGTITYKTGALTASDWPNFDPPASIPNLLVSGENVLAVEIHQPSGSSSDISMDLELTATVLDGTPPVISDLAETPSDESARIMWSTDEDADSHVFFYPVPTEPERDPVTVESFDYALTRSHNILLSGLTKSTEYEYFVTSSDRFGNKSTTDILRFTTRALNMAPTANNATMGVREDESGTITVTATDPDGGTLTYFTTSLPSHGTLSGAPPTWTYTPSPNYYGSDSFTFAVNDGATDSPSATVSITVDSVSDAPVATPLAATVAEDSTLAIELRGTDGDGDVLTYSVVTPPGKGSLGGSVPTLTYTPAANTFGSDSFTFSVSDSSGASSSGTVSITVTAVNDAPTVEDAAAETPEDKPVAITLSANDVDGDPLTYTITGPSHGTLSGAAPNLTYTPESNYSGTDGFTFAVTDGKGGSATATVSITVTAVNDTPTAPANLAAVAGNNKVNLSWDASIDAESDAFTYTILRNGGEIAAGVTASIKSYEDTAVVNGVTYTYVVRVVQGTFSAVSASATATPSAPDYRAYVISDPAVTVGTVAGSYTVLRPDTAGSQSLSELKSGLTASLDVTYSLQPATSEPYTSVTLKIAGNYSNLDASDALQMFFWYNEKWNLIPATSVVAGSHALPLEAVVNGVIKVRVTDSAAVRREKVDTLTLNDLYAELGTPAPVAMADVYSTPKDEVLTVAAAQGLLANDSDPEGGALTASLVSGPSNGALTFNTDGSFVYAPNNGFAGTDTFIYEAKDPTGLSTAATVSITVTDASALTPLASQISMVTTTTSKNWRATATVTMISGQSTVTGVTVQGTWDLNGVVTAAGPLVTDSNGVVTFTSPNYKNTATGTLTFKITGAVLEGYNYAPISGSDTGSVVGP